jgi:stress-induced-phosphoprotein 1
MALHALGRLEGALEAYEQGAKLDPSNTQIQQGLEHVQRDMMAQASPSGMPGGPGGMFGPQAEAKLKQNPRIAKYFEDPQFRNMWELSQ